MAGARALFVKSINGGRIGGGGALFVEGCMFSWLYAVGGWNCTRRSKGGRMVGGVTMTGERALRFMRAVTRRRKSEDVAKAIERREITWTRTPIRAQM